MQKSRRSAALKGAGTKRKRAAAEETFEEDEFLMDDRDEVPEGPSMDENQAEEYENETAAEKRIRIGAPSGDCV
jgi:hypothetical protein